MDRCKTKGHRNVLEEMINHRMTYILQSVKSPIVFRKRLAIQSKFSSKLRNVLLKRSNDC